jgi:serine/threonine protein kinase/tetratricopeptide (TPR) repeat protein
MTSYRDDVIFRDVLDRASDLSGKDRSDFLRTACGDDVEMRTRVVELLDALEEAGQFLADPTIDAPPLARAASRNSVPHGTRIDKYELLEPIGEGGMGTVYRARQHKPVRREVALKVIKLGMDTKRVIARFDAERQALAMMDHPSIAKVLDAGATETGRPYFVMDLVRGVRITDYCDQNLLEIPRRLDLFIQVCNAVQHAHQKGIIHRDLKPSNVLVTMQDGSPVPKIIDFGIAKATSEQPNGGEATQFTEMSQLVGTPMYMSPEQVENGGVNIDTRIDVYALGVLLYELLTGQTPFDRERLRSVPRDQLTKIICHEIPPRPAARLESMKEGVGEVASLRGTDRRTLTATLRGDLDWIVMRCLEKDRSRRYDTANALAHDVDRYLSDQPVEASPPSTLYLLSKFVHRHRPALAATFAFVMLLIIATAASSWQAVRATRAEAKSIREQKRADEQSQLAINELRRAVQVQDMIRHIILSAHPTAGSTGQDVSVVELLRNASRIVEKSLDKLPEPEIEVRQELADAFEELDELEDAGANLRRAYKLACNEAGGSRSPTAVRVAAKLAFHSDIQASQRAYDDALAMFGPNDPSTRRAAWGLSHVLGEQALSGIYRTDQLRRGQEILRRIIAQVNALPQEQTPSNLYQYMNGLAVLLNEDHKHVEAAEVVREALFKGSRDGLLRDGTRASLGFSLVESLRGQEKVDEAVDWARKTYEFDRATIGAFNRRTDRMLRMYIDLLRTTGRTDEADRLLKDTYAMARSFYPADNQAALEFLTTLADYLLDAGQTESAIPQLVRTARAQIDIPGKAQDRARLLAREALLASLGSKRQMTDGGLRTQVFSALEDMWRDHSEWFPPSMTISPSAVRYRLSRWDAPGTVVLEATLAEAGAPPADPGPGMYRMTVEVRSAELPPFSQTFGILVADWDTTTYGDEQLQPSDLPGLPTTSSVKLIDHRSVAAIATTYLFKDTPKTFSRFLRMRGSTRIHLPAGRYRFVTSSVDGIRLLVDGRVAIKSWSAHRPRRDARELELDEGWHELGFDSFQRGRRRLIWIRAEPVTSENSGPPLRSFERALKEQTEMECPEGNGTTGTLLVHAGRFNEALGEYAKAIVLDPAEPFWWQQTALVNLQLGDVPEYRAAVAKFLHDPLTKDDRLAAARATVVALAEPDAKIDAAVRARLAAADADTAPPAQRAECQLAQGLAAYRNGRFAGADYLLGQAAAGRLAPEAKNTANVFRALALYHAGDVANSRGLLASATNAAEAFLLPAQAELDSLRVQDRLICQLALREAQGVIR